MHKHSDTLAAFFRENPTLKKLDGLRPLRALSYHEAGGVWTLNPAARAFAFAAQPRAAHHSARAGTAWIAWSLWQGLKLDAQRSDYNEATRDGDAGWRVLFGTFGASSFAVDCCRGLALEGTLAAFANIDEVALTFDQAFELLIMSGASRLMRRYDRDPSGRTVFRAVPLDLLLLFAQGLNFDVRLVEHRARVDPGRVLTWCGKPPLGLIVREVWATLENRIGVLEAQQRVRRFGESNGNNYEWVAIPRVMKRLLREGRIEAVDGESYET